MREILFRGKRKDNGEWIEGYYVRLFEKENGFYKAKHYIFDGNTKLSEERYCGHGNYEQDVKICKFEVIPETVGQFTGLTDRKSKKKIFEGDIIDIHYENTIVRGAVVKYIGASFYGETVADTWELDDYHEIEVIGNIHDNPELVRGAEK